MAAGATTAAILVGLGLIVAVTWIDQRANPPTCYGIGWGCVPDAATFGVLLGFVVGLPAFTLAMLLIVGAWALGKLRPTAGLVMMWAPAVLIVMASVVLVLASAI